SNRKSRELWLADFVQIQNATCMYIQHTVKKHMVTRYGIFTKASTPLRGHFEACDLLVGCLSICCVKLIIFLSCPLLPLRVHDRQYIISWNECTSAKIRKCTHAITYHPRVTHAMLPRLV